MAALRPTYFHVLAWSFPAPLPPPSRGIPVAGMADDERRPTAPLEAAKKVPVPQTPPPPSELQTQLDMLAWKREYNIRQREAEWKRRQEEMIAKKQMEWTISRSERAERIAAARESRKREVLEASVFHRHREIDHRHKEDCREAAIEKRETAWLAAENGRLASMNHEAGETVREQERRIEVEKARLFAQMQADAARRAEKSREEAAIQKRRNDNIQAKEDHRRLSEAKRSQALKADSKAKQQATVRAFCEKTLPADACEESLDRASPV